MKLYFENANKDYDGFEGFIPVLIGSSWIGLAEVKDEIGKKLKDIPGVQVLSDEDWDWYKKKVGVEKIAFRQFSTIPQDPVKNPNANYAEETKKESGSSPSSDSPVIDVDVVDVIDPMEEIEDKPTPKPKAKRGKK